MEFVNRTAKNSISHAAYQAAGKAILEHHTQWSYEDGINCLRMGHFLNCTLEEMKRYQAKLINYNKVKEITHKKG